MGNFIVSYDLKSPRPTHKEMDEHMSKMGTERSRVLETVWYVAYAGTAAQLRDRVSVILGKGDLLLVLDCKHAAWTEVLLKNKSLLEAWQRNA